MIKEKIAEFNKTMQENGFNESQIGEIQNFWEDLLASEIVDVVKALSKAQREVFNEMFEQETARLCREENVEKIQLQGITKHLVICNALKLTFSKLPMAAMSRKEMHQKIDEVTDAELARVKEENPMFMMIEKQAIEVNNNIKSTIKGLI